MFSCLDKQATQTGFAKLTGVTKQAISQRCSAGQFPAGGTYASWLQIYIESLRSEAAGRSEKELGAIRGRKELAQARREEFELAKEMRMVVLIDDVAPGVTGILKEIQSRVIQAGKRSMQNIQVEHQIKIHDDVVLEPLRAALRDVAGSADQLVATLEGKPSRAVSAAFTADGGVDRDQLPAASGKQ